MAQHKVALITGSGTGIGANVAVDLASAGYSVIVTGRNICRLNKVVEQCKEVSNSSSTAVSFVADLFDWQQVDRLIDFVRLKFQRLDVLINNACLRGDNVRSILADDKDQDEFKKVLHINVSVPMYLIHKCLIPLKPKEPEKAVVLNISSVASKLVVPLHLYSISKACLSEMSEQVALISHDSGILSVTISPGPVFTNERPHHSKMKILTLMNRVGTTQEISNLIMFVLSKAHLFNGKEICIDGGYIAKRK